MLLKPSETKRCAITSSITNASISIGVSFLSSACLLSDSAPSVKIVISHLKLVS